MMSVKGERKLITGGSERGVKRAGIVEVIGERIENISNRGD